MQEEIIVMSNSDIKTIKSSLKSQAKIAKKYNQKNIQSHRFMCDSVAGSLVGVRNMNALLHGWDGRFDNGLPFENKNITSSAKSAQSYSLKLQDTSDSKLVEVEEGVMYVNSFWGEAGEPDFMIIGNTKTVKEQLAKSFDIKNRRSCTVSLSTCLKNGFKIVAVNYDKEQTMEAISNVFTRLGKNLTFEDIYTKKDLPALVAEMM